MKISFFAFLLILTSTVGATNLEVSTCRLAVEDERFPGSANYDYRLKTLFESKGYKLVTMEDLAREVMTNPLTMMKLAGSLGSVLTATEPPAGGVPKDLASVMCKKAKSLLFLNLIENESALQLEIGEGPQDTEACVRTAQEESADTEELLKSFNVLYKANLKLADANGVKSSPDQILARLGKIPNCVKSKK